MGQKYSEMNHDFNNEFDKLIRAADSGKLSKRLSSFYTRPLYYGTSQQMGGLIDAKRKNRAIL